MTVTNTTFTRGIGYEGVAIYCDQLSLLIMRNSLIEHSLSEKGGLTAFQAGYLDIQNCTFNSNIGIYADLDITESFNPSRLIGNTFLNGRGAVLLSKTSSIEISNCSVSNYESLSDPIIDFDDNPLFSLSHSTFSEITARNVIRVTG